MAALCLKQTLGRLADKIDGIPGKVLKLEEHPLETPPPQAFASRSKRRGALGSVTHRIGSRLSDAADPPGRWFLCRWPVGHPGALDRSITV